MFLEFVTLLVGYYLFVSSFMYMYSVVKSWEITNYWSFKPDKGYIGVVKYPRKFLFWIENASNTISKIWSAK